jgi:hypothetical protein
MSFEQLAGKTVIWDNILSWLTPKLPKPLSGVSKEEYGGASSAMAYGGSLKGSTWRKDIRAEALASLMRTSVVSHVSGSILSHIPGGSS